MWLNMLLAPDLTNYDYLPARLPLNWKKPCMPQLLHLPNKMLINIIECLPHPHYSSYCQAISEIDKCYLICVMSKQDILDWMAQHREGWDSISQLELLMLTSWPGSHAISTYWEHGYNFSWGMSTIINNIFFPEVANVPLLIWKSSITLHASRKHSVFYPKRSS